MKSAVTRRVFGSLTLVSCLALFAGLAPTATDTDSTNATTE